MNRLSGKKLLVLGASNDELTLVKRAQEFGVYVIVTDYNIDRKLSPAKEIANEAWDISWSDIDILEKKCRENKVDGVIAGYSEFRVESTIKLTKRLGLPCYCNEEQLEITRDKIKFKNECRKNGVPVIKEYRTPEEVDNFPVIVKPVDRAGSIGISVAENKEELQKSYEYAMEMSICKEVIIEDYINNATKFDSYYVIIDGEIQLISTDDVMMSPKNGYERVVQNGWILPSIHQGAYIEKVDNNLKTMIRNMGIKNGYIFFSGFADKNDNFVFFECGFRLCGGNLYNYFPKIGMCNTLDLFIMYSLLGKVDLPKLNIDLRTKLKCVTLNYYANKGIITQINGFDEVAKMKNCYFTMTKCHIGQQCNNDKAILSKIGMVYFCSESDDELIEDIKNANELISVLDENGECMIYDKVSVNNIHSLKEVLNVNYC